MLRIFVSVTQNTLQIIVVLDALNVIVAVGEEMSITTFLHKWKSHILNDVNLII